MDTLAELAATLVRDPAGAARAAQDIAAAARTAGDTATECRADVVRGRALLLLGEIALAEQSLTAADAAARTAADPALEAEARLALAAVQSAAGRHTDAFRSLDVVDAIGPPALAQRATLQRAAVCRDARRYDDALALFGAAIDRLRNTEGSRLDLARVLANCGGILMHRGRIDDAVAALDEAAALLRAEGHEFVALQVVHDLGCAEAYRGDLAAAMRLLDEAERGLAALGHDASFPLLSRAEALLRAGLTTDARDAAVEAARRLGAEGHAFAALALLTAAEATRLDGDPGGALALAERAIEEFGTVDAGPATGWERAAMLEAVRSRRELGRLEASDLDLLDMISTASAAAGDHRTQVEATALHATAAASLGTPELATAGLATAVALARRTRLAQLDATVATAETELALATGDLARARPAARRAHAAIASTRRMYGAGESNPALGTEGRAAADVMMRLAAAERTAARRLDWMERVRALAGAPLPAVERPQQFAALRALAAELRHAERTGEPTDELRHEQARLEADIRAALMRERPGRTEAPGTHVSDGLHRAVGDTTVVSIAFAGARTIAVVVDRRGSRSVELAASDSVRAAAARAGAALRGLSAAPSAAVAESRRRAFDAAVEHLDAHLLSGLGARTDDVVLVVPPELVAVPWAATPTLRRRRFSIAPSVAWWRSTTERPAQRGTTAAVIAGPRLEYADAEADGVAACHPGATLLRGSAATVAAATQALGSHEIAHVVAHGRFRRDNPLWSTIELADGPMPVYELRQLTAVPRTIVLATCESAMSAGAGGIELHGLATSLLALGALTIVASAGPLPDDATTRATMVAMHRELRAGQSPSASLARARADTAHGVPIDATAAALITIGLGS